MEEERNPGGGEELGVGGALVRREEHVGVDDVEGRGDERGLLRGEVFGEAVEAEACGGEAKPGVDDGGPRPWKDEAEEGSDGPGDGWVEDEAGFAGVPGGGVGPVRMQVAVLELPGGFEPVEDVEVEVVATGGAVEDEGEDGYERGEREDEVVEAVWFGGWLFGSAGNGHCPYPKRALCLLDQ